MSGINGVAAAIGQQATINAEAQTTTAVGLFALLACYMPLTDSFTKLLTEKQVQYFAATLAVIGKPDNAPLAAAAYQDYTRVSAQMDQELGGQNTLMQNGKTRLRAEGNANENLYRIEEPLVTLLKATSNSIQGFINI